MNSKSIDVIYRCAEEIQECLSGAVDLIDKRTPKSLHAAVVELGNASNAADRIYSMAEELGAEPDDAGYRPDLAEVLRRIPSASRLSAKEYDSLLEYVDAWRAESGLPVAR